MARIQLNVTLISDYTYTKSLTTWCIKEGHIYKMKDDDDNVYVWKTENELYIHVPCEKNDSRCYNRNVDKDGNVTYTRLESINKGDKFTITGSVKEVSEYKGEKQTVLTRCKVVDIISKVTTYEELQAQKREQQLASIEEGDFIYRMPYRQYKEHYADCEAIANSFDDVERTIDVIVRAGRLVASGVRFQHFSGYTFENEVGKKITYRAVSEENAHKRCIKEFPEHEWTCIKIYR